MNELAEEKIDIVPFVEDTVELIKNALSPTNINKVELDDKEHKATVEVPDDQLSIAIGKNGQNVRIASKLTGWQIDITGSSGEKKTAESKPAAKKPASKEDLEASLIASVDQSPEEPGKKEQPAKRDQTATTESKPKPKSTGVPEDARAEQTKQPAPEQAEQPKSAGEAQPAELSPDATKADATQDAAETKQSDTSKLDDPKQSEKEEPTAN